MCNKYTKYIAAYLIEIFKLIIKNKIIQILANNYQLKFCHN
jgi:hypothetical protein